MILTPNTWSFDAEFQTLLNKRLNNELFSKFQVTLVVVMDRHVVLRYISLSCLPRFMKLAAIECLDLSILNRGCRNTASANPICGENDGKFSQPFILKSEKGAKKEFPRPIRCCNAPLRTLQFHLS